MEALQTITYYNKETGEVSREERRLKAHREAELDRQIESNVVGLYPDYLFQEIDGFGCAMTETACYLLSQMEPEVRREALKRWFGAEGIKARFIRIPIDSCDYSLEEYQAVENPLADPELQTFSIGRDKKYIIPVVREAMALCKEPVCVLLSPWSPPVQWKTPPEIKKNDAAVYGGKEESVDLTRPNRCFGGRLKPEYYASWAKYLVKYVKAYLEEGLNVTMLSVQNEANAATSWDSCVWSGEQEREFLVSHLYPAMREAGLHKKIGLYIWDHNKERMIEHVGEVMEGEAGDMIQGFAYHWYTGDHFEALSLLRGRYPDKVLMHSESCGLHIPGKVSAFDLPEDKRQELPPEMQELFKVSPLEVDFQDAQNYAHDIIGDINHGMNRWIDWNMIVDRTGGPRHVPGGFAAPMIAEKDGSYTCTVSYAYIRQIARTILPGSRRMGISVYGQDVEAAAVKNPDGTVGLALLNRQKRQLPVALRLQGYLYEITLPGETLSTVLLDMDKE